MVVFAVLVDLETYTKSLKQTDFHKNIATDACLQKLEYYSENT